MTRMKMSCHIPVRFCKAARTTSQHIFESQEAFLPLTLAEKCPKPFVDKKLAQNCKSTLLMHPNCKQAIPPPAPAGSA